MKNEKIQNLESFNEDKEGKISIPSGIPNDFKKGIDNIERICNSIQKAIDNKIYTYICIWNYDEKRKPKYINVQRPNNSSSDGATARIKWIRFALEESTLKKGSYVVQCKLARYTGGDGDLFGFVVDDSILKHEVKILDQNKIEESKIDESMISIDEYTSLVKELAQAKAQVQLLTLQLEMERKFQEAARPALSEGPKWANTLSDALSQIVTTGIPLLAQHMMSKTGQPQQMVQHNTGMSQGPQDEISNYVNYFNSIRGNDEHFWNELENLEQVNKNACDEVMKRLNVTWEE